MTAETAFETGKEYPIADIPCIRCGWKKCKENDIARYFECCLCGHRFSREELEDSRNPVTAFQSGAVEPSDALKQKIKEEFDLPTVERFNHLRQMIGEMQSSFECFKTALLQAKDSITIVCPRANLVYWAKGIVLETSGEPSKYILEKRNNWHELLYANGMDIRFVVAESRDDYRLRGLRDPIIWCTEEVVDSWKGIERPTTTSTANEGAYIGYINAGYNDGTAQVYTHPVDFSNLVSNEWLNRLDELSDATVSVDWGKELGLKSMTYTLNGMYGVTEFDGVTVGEAMEYLQAACDGMDGERLENPNKGMHRLSKRIRSTG